MENDRLMQVRPAFGSSLVAKIQSQRPIQMATVRPGTFQPVPHPVETPRREQLHYDGRGAAVRLLTRQAYQEGVPLTQANIILAGGMGIGSKEGFRKLAALAQKMGRDWPPPARRWMPGWPLTAARWA